ncbi:hypothetical protein TURU_104927 [Turdus rufiventris]|nr:hypothetical protein TURU_104927 [Turdus rufiventris]
MSRGHPEPIRTTGSPEPPRTAVSCSHPELRLASRCRGQCCFKQVFSFDKFFPFHTLPTLKIEYACTGFVLPIGFCYNVKPNYTVVATTEQLYSVDQHSV